MFFGLFGDREVAVMAHRATIWGHDCKRHYW